MRKEQEKQVTKERKAEKAPAFTLDLRLRHGWQATLTCLRCLRGRYCGGSSTDRLVGAAWEGAVKMLESLTAGHNSQPGHVDIQGHVDVG